MRSMKVVAFGALALLSFAGCNTGQPRIYRVALNENAVREIRTPTCFRNSNLPSGQQETDNYRGEQEWVIWGGVDGTEYLDVGNYSERLGSSPEIRVIGLIEGKDRTFSAVRTVVRPEGDQFIEQRQTGLTVTFNDYSASPVGTLALRSVYACSNARGTCPTGDLAPQDAASCDLSLPFVARRIDAEHITAYGNNP